MKYHSNYVLPEAIEIGDKMQTWFSDTEDGFSTVLAIYPYVGKYTKMFKRTVRVTAPRTRRGWIPLCI